MVLCMVLCMVVCMVGVGVVALVGSRLVLLAEGTYGGEAQRDGSDEPAAAQPEVRPGGEDTEEQARVERAHEVRLGVILG